MISFFFALKFLKIRRISLLIMKFLLLSLFVFTCSLSSLVSAKYILGKELNSTSVAIFESNTKIDKQNPGTPLYIVSIDDPLVKRLLAAEKNFNDAVSESGLLAQAFLKKRELELYEFTPVAGSVLQKRCNDKPASSCRKAVVCDGSGQNAPCSHCPDSCKCTFYIHGGGSTDCCVEAWFCS